MTKLFLSVTLLLCFISIQAQDAPTPSGELKIIGKIIDSISQRPIEYASISLLNAVDRKVLNGTISGSDGKFVLSNLSEGTYNVTIEFIGYSICSFNSILVSKKMPILDLKDVKLSANHQTLQNVTVSSKSGLIENKIDKLIFNAEKDLTSQGGVATDILRKVPQVSVDVDGNVELAGSSSIRFLIDGKPSAAFGSNITDVLQSIPSSQIKSIEVITNPGAKYDAQGIGGIINIILKQNKAKGINGNLSLTAGTRNENGSFNLNVRRGNLGFNAFISGNARLKAKTPISTNRISNDPATSQQLFLQQLSLFENKRHGIQSGIGFDWTYKERNSFTGAVRVENFGYSGTGNIEQVQNIMQSGNPISSVSTINKTNSSNTTTGINGNLNFKKTFVKEDQQLEIDFNTYYGEARGTTNNLQSILPQDSLYYGTKGQSPGKEGLTQLQIDYTQPLREDVKLGIGTKVDIDNINTRATVFSYLPMDKMFAYDNSLSNTLRYKQNVYAVYAEINFPVRHLFDAKVGGRYERTATNSFYSNAQQQAGRTGYNTFVPSLFFLKKINEAQTIKLSYSKRIERPEYDELNPFINTTDSKNISGGNPFLKPEIGHRIELSYSRDFNKTGSLMITAFYRINENDIQPFIVFYPSLKVGDSIYTNVSLNTRQNIGTERNKGVNIFMDFHPGTKFTVRSNIFAFQRHTINKQDIGYNSNSFNYRFNLNTTYQFNKNLVAEAFGNFNSARHEAQGKYPSFITYSFAIRKQFWSKKASLALTATNPFAKYSNQRTSLFGPNFSVIGLRQIPFRSIGINFFWKFGKLEFKKDKDEKIDAGPSSPEG